MNSLTNIQPYENVWVEVMYTDDGQKRVKLMWTEFGTSYSTSLTPLQARSVGLDLGGAQRMKRAWVILENAQLAAIINSA